MIFVVVSQNVIGHKLVIKSDQFLFYFFVIFAVISKYLFIMVGKIAFLYCVM